VGSSIKRREEGDLLLSDVQVTATDLTPHGAGSFVIKGMAPAGQQTGTFDASGKVSDMPWHKNEVLVRLANFPLCPV
jgi:hypothetical protein